MLSVLPIWRGSGTSAKLYLYEAPLQRLVKHLEDMALVLLQLIQAQNAVVGQRHLPRQWYLTAANQPHNGWA